MYSGGLRIEVLVADGEKEVECFLGRYIEKLQYVRTCLGRVHKVNNPDEIPSVERYPPPCRVGILNRCS